LQTLKIGFNFKDIIKGFSTNNFLILLSFSPLHLFLPGWKNEIRDKSDNQSRSVSVADEYLEALPRGSLWKGPKAYMENEKIEKLDYYAAKTARELAQWKYPEIKIKRSSRNIFVGAGDADNTGRILAQNFGGAGFSVVDYKRFFENDPERDHEIYIVNASGAKDGIKMAQWLTENGYQPKLITSNPEPPAGKFLKPEDVFVFPAIIEPPTYNVSTYAAMLYGVLKENITGLSEKLAGLKAPDLRKYKFVFFLTDDKYEIVGRIAKRKIAETLAGLGADAGGYSNAAHGMLLQPNPDRLVVTLNCKYDGSGDVYALEGDSYLELILSIHYIIGKNQTDSDSETILRNYFENAKKQGWQFNKVW